MTSDPEIDPDVDQLDQELPINEQALPVLATLLAQAFSALSQDDQELLRNHLASQADGQSSLTACDAERIKVHDILARLRNAALEQGQSSERADATSADAEPPVGDCSTPGD